MDFQFSYYVDVELSAKTQSEQNFADYKKFLKKKEKVIKKTHFSAASRKYQKMNDFERVIKGYFDVDISSVNTRDLKRSFSEMQKFL